MGVESELSITFSFSSVENIILFFDI